MKRNTVNALALLVPKTQRVLQHSPELQNRQVGLLNSETNAA